MADLKSLLPHIKRAVLANCLLFAYYMSPSFMSFFALVVAVFVIIFDHPVDSFNSLINCSECRPTDTLNCMYNKYTATGLIERRSMSYS